jgi:hypothetical protein
MLVSQPTQLTQENDRRRKHSRASDPEWEIGISGFKLAVSSRFSAAARPTMGTFGVGLYEKGSTAHDEIETSERRGCWERIEEEGGRTVGEREFYGR